MGLRNISHMLHPRAVGLLDATGTHASELYAQQTRLPPPLSRERSVDQQIPLNARRLARAWLMLGNNVVPGVVRI